MGSPVCGEYAREARAYNSRKKSLISVTVPTVERGFLFVVFCSMATTGLRPVMWSTSGRSILPTNWRAYAESVSI